MSGEDASKPGKADPDFDPVLEEKNMTKEQHARAIRADRGGENPEQSLLDALEDDEEGSREARCEHSQTRRAPGRRCEHSQTRRAAGRRCEHFRSQKVCSEEGSGQTC